jgi:hypothetical protein
MQVLGVRGDFVERFNVFADAYDRARSKEEKSCLAEDFLKTCNSDEIALVRDAIGDVLQKNGRLSCQLFH